MIGSKAELPRRPCQECGRRVLPGTSKALRCKPCKAIRRELSRTVPRTSLRGMSATDIRDCSAYESTAHVDRLLAAAERRRKRHERQHGRTYTVDPWQQRAGRSAMDGEIRMTEVAS